MMKQLFQSAKRASIVLLAMFVIACGDDTEEPPQVTSSFTQTIDNATGTVTFTNTSTNATSYLWDFDDGNTSTEFEPVNVYETGTYTVTLTASNSSGSEATSENTFTVTVPGSIDTTLPIITLVGEATINLTVGDPYTDQGATANDNLDGNITANIVKGGDAVNTSTPGTYVITYNVSDAAGNAATAVTRSVIVTAFDDGLLTNGAFSSTTEAWSGNGFFVKNEGGTNFNFVNVAVAGNPFDVNLSQVLTLTQGEYYVLSFDASSDRSRTMLAGIGLSVDPWTSDVRTVEVTTTMQRFTLELRAASFGGANSRVIFDMGAAVGVVVLDNVSLVVGTPPACALELPINFDDCASSVYAFGTFNGASYEVVDNPHLSGANNVASKVGKIVNTGVQQYEGGAFNLATPVDFATNKSIKMKVYSPVALPVLLKFEGAGAIETSVDHGGTGWEELTFDFTSSAQFPTLVLFIDGPGFTAGTFYMDDIKQVATAGGSCPAPPADDLVSNGGFETGTTVCWTSFAAANNGTFEATNTQAKTGTYSGLLVADVPAGGGPTSFPIAKAANIGIGTITPSKSVTVTFDLYGSVAGAGGVVFVEFFSELSGGGTSSSVILGGGPLFPTGTWTNYSFTTTTGNDVSGGVTVQIKADCGANPGCRVEAFFDNVSVKIN